MKSSLSRRAPRIRASPRHGGAGSFVGIFFDLQNPFQAFIKNAWTHQKVDLKKPSVNEKIVKGVKGLLPLGCLPLWGREGVTLKDTTKSKEQ
jgi:hypothetical protein